MKACCSPKKRKWLVHDIKKNNNFIFSIVVMDDSIDKVKSWMHNNQKLFSQMISLAMLIFGILMIVGAVKNWDLLYKPDESYHNRWTIGQISRYLGRDTARIIGVVGGLLLVVAGAVWSYKSFSKI